MNIICDVRARTIQFCVKREQKGKWKRTRTTEDKLIAEQPNRIESIPIIGKHFIETEWIFNVQSNNNTTSTR